jgi:hypothetical protein
VLVPDAKLNYRGSMRIRYLVDTAVSSGAITADDLLSSVLLTSSTTVGWRIFLAVRLKEVHIYWQGSYNTAPEDDDTNVISFEMLGGDNAAPNAWISTAQASVPRTRRFKPTPDTLSGFWYRHDAANVANQLCKFTLPVGTIMDISFDFILRGFEQPTTSGYTVVGATAGRLTYMKLVSNDLLPQGMPTAEFP